MSALARAEAATLGALLLHPDRASQVTGWLRSSDFADPWHTQLYTLIRERQTAAEPTDAQAVGAAFLSRVGPRRADLPRVHDLLRATPLRPQLRHYAAMVLEASLRREMRQQGLLLRAGALQSSLLGAAHPVAAVAALISATVDAAETRWHTATGRGRIRPEPASELGPGVRDHDRYLRADRLLAAHDSLYLDGARANERLLIASLVHQPAQADSVAAWLRPACLLDKQWRAVYAAIVDLADQRQPVDEVTLAWRLQQAQARWGAGPDEPGLRAGIDAASGTDPGYAARLVGGDFVRRIADAAARALTLDAANPGLQLVDLLDTTRLLAIAVRSAARGLPEHVDGPRQTDYPTPSRALIPSAAADPGLVAG